MIKNYLKIFWKVAKQNKLFTFLSLFGISLTIMFVMIFSMTINKVLKGSGPEKNLAKMVFVDGIKGKSTVQGESSAFTSKLSRNLCQDYLKNVKSADLASMFTSSNWEFILNGKHYTKSQMQTDAEFWKLFDFKFIQGRPYNTEDVVNKNNSVVISTSIKDLYFGDEKNVIGKTIKYFNLLLTIQGVVEDPSPVSQFLRSGIYFPYTLINPIDEDPYMGSFSMAYKASGRSQLVSIRKEVQDIISRIDAADDKTKLFLFGPYNQLEMLLIGYEDPEEYASPTGKFLKYLLWGIGFIFLPAVNLMALNFARIRERGEEIAIRKSFGAGSMILRGQFVFENILLTLAGGMIGIILAFLAVAFFGSSLSIPVNDWDTVQVSFSFDFLVFGAALGCCLLFGLFSGVLPAIRMSRMKPVKYLKGGEL